MIQAEHQLRGDEGQVRALRSSSLRAAAGLVSILSVVVFCLASGAFAEARTEVYVSPGNQTVSPGQTFTVDVVIVPVEPIAGAQFDLIFDATVLAANSVVEGGLLRAGGASTFFNQGTIDNGAGSIVDVYGAIVGAGGGSVASTGTFATIEFAAKTKVGSSSLGLSGVKVGSASAHEVPVHVSDGQVAVLAPPTASPAATPTPRATSTAPGVPADGPTPDNTPTSTPAAVTPAAAVTPFPTSSLMLTPSPSAPATPVPTAMPTAGATLTPGPAEAPTTTGAAPPPTLGPVATPLPTPTPVMESGGGGIDSRVVVAGALGGLAAIGLIYYLAAARRRSA